MVDGVHHGTSMSDAPQGIQVRRETTIVYVTEQARCRSEPTTSVRWPRASPLTGHTSNDCAGRAFVTAEEFRRPLMEWPPVQRALAARESRVPLTEVSPASVDAEAGGRTATYPVSQQSGAVHQRCARRTVVARRAEVRALRLAHPRPGAKPLPAAVFLPDSPGRRRQRRWHVGDNRTSRRASPLRESSAPPDAQRFVASRQALRLGQRTRPMSSLIICRAPSGATPPNSEASSRMPRRGTWPCLIEAQNHEPGALHSPGEVSDTAALPPHGPVDSRRRADACQELCPWHSSA